jgi:hypothetical protein
MISFADEPWWHWLFVIVPVGLMVSAVLAAVILGDARGARGLRGLLVRLGSSMERFSGVPGWAGAPIWSTIAAILMAGIGLYWDVSWHIDLGRDRALFTVPHVLVLLGLTGILVSGVLSIALATAMRAPTAWHAGRLRLPRGGVVLAALGLCEVIGFPLDDLWHSLYGIDVTLWSPTHETMILAGGLAPLALWVLAAEAGQLPGRGWRGMALRRNLTGILLLGFTVQQLEFDTGVPQWQMIYQPVLIAATCALGMVAARAAFGRGWALIVAVNFVVSRLLVLALVGGLFGLTAPRFPLYLGSALAVEAVFLVGSRRAWRPLRLAIVSGVAVGTVGMASEWLFSQVFGRQPWQPSLLSMMWLPLAIAVAAAICGVAVGRIGSGRSLGMRGRIPLIALVAVLLLLLVPAPRQGLAATADVAITPSSASTEADPRVDVAVRFSPSDAGDGADALRVVSWQGGGSLVAPLLRGADGAWHSSAPVPVGGNWKSLVMLSRGSTLAVVAVRFPADPEYALPPIVARTRTAQPLLPASDLLLREERITTPWLADVAEAAFAVATLGWLALIVAAFAGIDRQRTLRLTGTASRPSSRARRQYRPAAAGAR